MLNRDTETFGSMDPYVKVFYNNQAFATKKSSGKNPVWTSSNVFNFKLTGEPMIRFAVYDHDTFSNDDIIGEGQAAIS